MAAEVKKVRSPCVNVCALNQNDVCIGCQRTGEEIRCWSTMTDAERQEVLLKVAEREKNFAL